MRRHQADGALGGRGRRLSCLMVMAARNASRVAINARPVVSTRSGGLWRHLHLALRAATGRLRRAADGMTSAASIVLSKVLIKHRRSFLGPIASPFYGRRAHVACCAPKLIFQRLERKDALPAPVRAPIRGECRLYACSSGLERIGGVNQREIVRWAELTSIKMRTQCR